MAGRLTLCLTQSGTLLPPRQRTSSKPSTHTWRSRPPRVPSRPDWILLDQDGEQWQALLLQQWRTDRRTYPGSARPLVSLTIHNMVSCRHTTIQHLPSFIVMQLDVGDIIVLPVDHCSHSQNDPSLSPPVLLRSKPFNINMPSERQVPCTARFKQHWCTALFKQHWCSKFTRRNIGFLFPLQVKIPWHQLHTKSSSSSEPDFVADPTVVDSVAECTLGPSSVLTESLINESIVFTVSCGTGAEGIPRL